MDVGGDATAAHGADRGHILVVDDDQGIRQVLRGLLEDDGYVVETAADGGEAVERLKAHRPDLVVLDLGLPVLSGPEVAAELRATHGTSVPIVAISADSHAAEGARQAQAQTYFHKPFDLDALLETIDRMIRRYRGAREARGATPL